MVEHRRFLAEVPRRACALLVLAGMEGTGRYSDLRIRTIVVTTRAALHKVPSLPPPDQPVARMNILRRALHHLRTVRLEAQRRGDPELAQAVSEAERDVLRFELLVQRR